MNYGFIYRAPEEGDYHQDGKVRLGGLPIMPNGDWSAFLPPDELQDRNLPTMACATFGTLNAVEILERQEFGDTTDWSDRFLAEQSGTTQQGNDPFTVAQTLRKGGVVYETDWPYVGTTWGEFYQTPPYDTIVQAIVKFKGKYDFGYSYVGTDQQSMMNALQFSPLGADVFAWNVPDADGIYHRNGAQSEHWIVIYGYEKNKYWKCLDTYDNTRKKLAWDFGFTMPMQYTLHRTVLTTNPTNPLYQWAQAIRYFIEKLHLNFQKTFGLGDYHADRLGGAERSPQWPRVRREWLEKHPNCAVCEKKPCEVHHQLPFHLDPSLELAESNFISLCRDHHFLFGHLLNWSSFDAEVEVNSRVMHDRIKNRP